MRRSNRYQGCRLFSGHTRQGRERRKLVHSLAAVKICTNRLFSSFFCAEVRWIIWVVSELDSNLRVGRWGKGIDRHAPNELQIDRCFEFR